MNRLRQIPQHLIPINCRKCNGKMRPTERYNRFVCRKNVQHERWIQSGFVAYVIITDPDGNTYLTERGIPPAIGGHCFPGGYIDFGDTSKETVIHEAKSEVKIDLNGIPLIYLDEFFEPGPAVTVIAHLAIIGKTNIKRFRPNKESRARVVRNIWELERQDLAFNGNWLALIAARAKLTVMHQQKEIA